MPAYQFEALDAQGETRKGVIEAENGACSQYDKIIALCNEFDYVTQDLCVTLLGDEQEHRREFIGFLKEYEKAR